MKIKIEQKVFAHRLIGYKEGKVSCFSSDVSDKYWVCLGEVTLTGEIEDLSEAEATKVQIAALKESVQKIQIKADIEKDKVKEDIQSLMALEVSE